MLNCAHLTLETLTRCGWMVLELDAATEEQFHQQFTELASSLGTPVTTRCRDPLVATLHPTVSTQARKNSLSAKFSTGTFPCHADTAHWMVPCRYILLGCLDPGCGDRETFLLDTRTLPLSTDQQELLFCTPFCVVNGRNSFFSTILRRGRPFVRYDPGCMRPTSPNGELAIAVLAADAWVERLNKVHWRRGKVLIIDNWRILHGRGEASREDGRRTLLRTYVNGGVE